MKKFTSLLLAVILVLACTACQAKPAAQEAEAPAPAAEEPAAAAEAPAEAEAAPAEELPEVTIKFATTYSPGSSIVDAMQMFKDEMYKRSNGKFNVELYTDGTLGSDNELYELIELGEVDMAIVGTVGATIYAPEYSFLDAPFCFESKQHYLNVWTGELGDKVRDIFKEHNIRWMDWVDIGDRWIASTIPLTNLETDFPKLTIRMPTSKPYLGAFEVAGCNIATLPMSETFTALQLGTVNAVSATLMQIYNLKFYEVAKYLTHTNHFWITLWWQMSESCYQSLPAAYQEMIDEVVPVCARYGDSQYLAMEQGMIDEMKAAGCEFVDEIDLTWWRETVAPLYDEFYATDWANVTTREEIESYK